jgi:hypothetical protein
MQQPTKRQCWQRGGCLRRDATGAEHVGGKFSCHFELDGKNQEIKIRCGLRQQPGNQLTQQQNMQVQ